MHGCTNAAMAGCHRAIAGAVERPLMLVYSEASGVSAMQARTGLRSTYAIALNKACSVSSACDLNRLLFTGM
mgnify:CR=1 FL=1